MKNFSQLIVLTVALVTLGCGQSAGTEKASLSSSSEDADFVQQLFQINKGILSGAQSVSKSPCSIEIWQAADGEWEARFSYLDLLSQEQIDETVPMQKFNYHGAMRTIQSGVVGAHLIDFSETGVFEEFSVWDWRGRQHAGCQLPAYSHRTWDPIP